MDAWLAAEEPGDFREAVLRDERFLTLHIAARAPTGSLVGVAVKDVPWPEGTLLALVRREGAILIPSGDTALRAGDRLSIVGHAEGIRAVRARYLTVADVEIPDFISEELDGQEPASDPE
jgi:NhaP-type Na+/H+ and K+/H+ antiporter